MLEQQAHFLAFCQTPEDLIDRFSIYDVVPNCIRQCSYIASIILHNTIWGWGGWHVLQV